MGRKTTSRFLRSVGAASLIAAALALLGCQPVVSVRARPHTRTNERIEPIRTIAVAPFSKAGKLAGARSLTVEESPWVTPDDEKNEATVLVSRYFAEALEQRGLLVVPADDVHRMLESVYADYERVIPLQVARIAAERFGADAVIVGSVGRYRERSRDGGGASVGFEVALYEAPSGRKLWSANFDETQRPLSENIFNASRLPGGGSRWLTADELAKWGAGETARQVPLGSSLGTPSGSSSGPGAGSP